MKNAEQSTIAISPSDLSDALILVVDDNEIKRYTARRTLEQAGFPVIEATTGEEALALFGPEGTMPRPWLIVLDVRLPGIDGLEVCRRIKDNPDTASVLVLHISAHHVGAEDRVSGMDAGADGYVAVPVDARVLVAQVRALLRLARAERTARDAARIAHESEVRLLTILESLEEGVTLHDADGMIRVTNASAERVLGLTRDELHGRTWSEEHWSVVAEDGSPVSGERYPPLLALKEAHAVVGEVVGVHTPNQGVRWISINSHPLFDASGQGTGVVSSFFDITERRQLEQERAEAAAKQEHIAETLQRSLLLTPPVDAFSGLDVHVEYEAAWKESLVGGDFADIFALDDVHVALVVGDVTGKGLLAATYTAEIKFALRAFLRESPDPARALHRLNHYLIEGQRLDTDPHQEYVALAIGVINRETYQIQCSSAGAEPPLIVRNKENGEMSAEEIEVSGPLLAIDTISEYQTVTTHLGKGDLFALTTDGITEARMGSRSRDLFGYERFSRAAEVAARTPSLETAARAIVAEAHAFAGGNPGDDICLLMVRATPQPTGGD